MGRTDRKGGVKVSRMFATPMYMTVVGPDGAGKDTAWERYFAEVRNAVMFREPGGSPVAEIIRSVLLENGKMDREGIINRLVGQEGVHDVTKRFLEKASCLLAQEGLSGRTEAVLYAASRAQTNREVVTAALRTGQSVFGSRSIACSMAYQGHARGLGMKEVWEVNQPAMTVYPDLELFFDVPTDTALERIRNRKGKQDRLDLEQESFHRLSREGYHRYYESYCPYPYTVIDASRSKEEVFAQLTDVLDAYTIADNCK